MQCVWFIWVALYLPECMIRNFYKSETYILPLRKYAINGDILRFKTLAMFLNRKKTGFSYRGSYTAQIIRG